MAAGNTDTVNIKKAVKVAAKRLIMLKNLKISKNPKFVNIPNPIVQYTTKFTHFQVKNMSKLCCSRHFGVVHAKPVDFNFKINTLEADYFPYGKEW